MISISGVYAEDIDVKSSVVTESPISADVESSLSSCDAFNNDLSNIYEPSDLSYSYESFDSYDSYESLEMPQINNKISFADYCNSYDYYESADMPVIDVGYNYMDSSESVDVPVIDVDYAFGDAANYYEFANWAVTDFDVNENVDYDSLTMSAIGMCDEDGEINQTIEIVEDKVILNNYNSYSKNILEDINIPVLAQNYLSLHDGVDENSANAIISEVTSDTETSESYELIGYVTQEDNSLKFENVNAILAINVYGIPDASEPVSDGILRVSEYISAVEEVYFGILSKSDNEKLLKSVGSENTLLFASMANWYSVVTLDTLQKLANHEQDYEEFLDVNTVTKALLRYYPRTNEINIYRLGSGSDDKLSHVINDTNSHGLDYAYAKHVNVNNKDMPNLMFLTSYGIVFIEKRSSAGGWDGLNDTLLDSVSSETLLPDHNAIWTPLLLLQQNSNESAVDGHADDNKKKNKIKTKDKTGGNDNNKSNSSNKSHHGWKRFYFKNWGYSHNDCCHYGANANVASYIGTTYLGNSTVNSTLNSTKNSTKDKNSSNVTTNGKRKTIGSPKTDVKEGPTYTLVYAIIGIAFVSYLFNSSYMRRDD